MGLLQETSKLTHAECVEQYLAQGPRWVYVDYYYQLFKTTTTTRFLVPLFLVVIGGALLPFLLIITALSWWERAGQPGRGGRIRGHVFVGKKA